MLDSEPVQEDPLGTAADERFVEEVVGSGVYTEAHVLHVRAKLKPHCASGGNVLLNARSVEFRKDCKLLIC